jgi:hypothetical protein
MLSDTRPVAGLAVNRTIADLAAEMIAIFGSSASDEAKARVERSRGTGNAVTFATWRQTERLIAILSAEASSGTIH